jgi:hypothetical protein
LSGLIAVLERGKVVSSQGNSVWVGVNDGLVVGLAETVPVGASVVAVTDPVPGNARVPGACTIGEGRAIDTVDAFWQPTAAARVIIDTARISKRDIRGILGIAPPILLTFHAPKTNAVVPRSRGQDGSVGRESHAFHLFDISP